MSKINKHDARARRHQRLRRQISGTAARPRMAVFRTAEHLYVQVIDDDRQHTLAAASTLSPEFRQLAIRGSNVAGAVALGKIIAGKALGAEIKQVVFDRGGFMYQGRIKALADAARAAGLEF